MAANDFQHLEKKMRNVVAPEPLYDREGAELYEREAMQCMLRSKDPEISQTRWQEALARAENIATLISHLFTKLRHDSWTQWTATALEGSRDKRLQEMPTCTRRMKEMASRFLTLNVGSTFVPSSGRPCGSVTKTDNMKCTES